MIDLARFSTLGALPAPTFSFAPLNNVYWLDTPTTILMLVVLTSLAVAFAVGEVLKRQPETTINPAVVRTFNSRVYAWWMMFAILVFGVLLGLISVVVGRVSTVVLFFAVSFWALREFITLTPTRGADHRALFWVFFIFTPLQYLLVGLDVVMTDFNQFYRWYSIMIPVYGSLLIPARVALAGDYKRFLERIAKIQMGLLICVYALSYAPAILHLRLQTSDGKPWEGSAAGLLFYFVLVVQLGDVFQFSWDKLIGRRVIAPPINAGKTWEGFFGGVVSAALVGMLLWWVTPFRMWEAFCVSLVIATMGFAGSMTMSAIKRDRGVRDYGTLVRGHVGVLDRIDCICFAAPVFYHITRFFFANQSLAPLLFPGSGLGS